jgi:hypothetical protein
MKFIASSLLVLGLLAVQVSEANAVVCARGPYRAGCAGPHGAVGVHRGLWLWRVRRAALRRLWCPPGLLWGRPPRLLSGAII